MILLNDSLKIKHVVINGSTDVPAVNTGMGIINIPSIDDYTIINVYAYYGGVAGAFNCIGHFRLNEDGKSGIYCINNTSTSQLRLTYTINIYYISNHLIEQG